MPIGLVSLMCKSDWDEMLIQLKLVAKLLLIAMDQDHTYQTSLHIYPRLESSPFICVEIDI